MDHGDDYVNKLHEATRDLKIERYKLQTEKLENNRWLREYARDELFMEKVTDAIAKIPQMQFPVPIGLSDKRQREFVLMFGDEHYGAEFEIYGLFGEIINQYNPDIFERRMRRLLDETIQIVKKESIEKLYVFSLGDFTDGLLRVGQLIKLRYGVIEGSVRYANFIANWLNELSEYVNVEYQMTFGNHSELRMLNQPKGTFKDENTGLFVVETIKQRLKGNPNFIYKENPTGLIFDNICGMNILGVHGEVKNMEQAIKDFSTTYKIPIDILVAGHLHHAQSEVVGINKETIRVPSIIGVDDFSMSLNKTSNPGATLVALEQGRGKVMEYNIKLD